jgi:5-(carboxyamino)imidazole ribonucleotide mutase
MSAPATRPIAILLGSDSDLPALDGALRALQELGIGCHVRILSAHRTPDALLAFLREAEAGGVEVFLAAAGMSAHLAGVVAAHTLRPVLGIAIDSGPMRGEDALWSTVMMPPGVPVAATGIGAAGATNAALMAARILALRDPALRQRLDQRRDAEREKVLAKDRAVRERYGG